ncbi:hypothetical protein ACFSKU_10155 [Pontibacter silvestris]|uniref:Uncharacterized protein n=1 Tax=Pontibacter silvestris TaxID=2305183 RepID=A0ABW4WYC6_9BACT|nr:hypothetical protein [Pontibacter silvestris]MCC9136799.1 hypothetical protein [Pontibacter silvestris]
MPQYFKEKINLINQLLSLYQLIGYFLFFASLAYETISTNDGMGVILILLAAIFLLLFIIIALVSIIYRIDEHRTKTWLIPGVVFMVLPCMFLPFFYETSGIIIAVVSITIGTAVYLLRKRSNIQLLLYNTIGSLLASFLLIISFITLNL